MKHTFLVIFLIIGFGKIGYCQSPGKTIRQIELSKISRGYEEAVRINADSMHIWIDNKISGKPPFKSSRKLEPDQWIKLVQSLESVKLKDIPALTSPSMKRAVDAAKHATLTITTADGKTYAHGYDDEDPNKMLQPLLKAVREITGPEDERN